MNNITFIWKSFYSFDEILEDYLEVRVYCKNRDGKFEKKYIFAPCTQDNEYLNLYHAAMGVYGNAYCSTIDEKLIKANPKDGKIRKKFSWLPGIILTGCNFAGTEVSEYLRNVLVEHGAQIFLYLQSRTVETALKSGFTMKMYG